MITDFYRILRRPALRGYGGQEDAKEEMREDRKSLYEKIVGRRNFVSESEAEFLAGCSVKPETDEARLAIAVRKALAEFAGVKSDEVLSVYQIESDLGISPLDSLNLVDLMVTMEKETGIYMSEEVVAGIGNLHEGNPKVRDLIRYLVSVGKN